MATANFDVVVVSGIITLFSCLLQIVEISGQATLVPFTCNSDVYDIDILKKATYWHTSVPGKCYDSYGDQSKPCDFYFRFCQFLPTTTTGGRGEIGASQNDSQSTSSYIALGGLSTFVAEGSGSLLITAFNGGDEVACGELTGILMYLQCAQDAKWNLSPDGSGEIPAPVEITLYNNTGACSYNITLRYDGACTKIGPSVPYQSSISAGSILIIIFFCSAVVYLVGGVVLNHTAGATGTELIPNLEWWKALPGLIADGAFFFWSCMLCRLGGTPEHSGYDSI